MSVAGRELRGGARWRGGVYLSIYASVLCVGAKEETVESSLPLSLRVRWRWRERGGHLAQRGPSPCRRRRGRPLTRRAPAHTYFGIGVKYNTKSDVEMC